MSRRCLELVELADKAGWRIDKTRCGVRCWPPDKSKKPVTVHLTVSDHAVFVLTRSKFRRGGLAC